MTLLNRFQLLKDSVELTKDRIQLPGGVTVTHLEFHSRHGYLLPGRPAYSCEVHGPLDHAPDTFANDIGVVSDILDRHDADVKENQSFRYPVFHPAGQGKAHRAILLFHGFNEKYWSKYLPWAHFLTAETGSTVVLFPISFHMNRAPQEWSDRRLMHRVSALRKEQFPKVIATTLSNVAISTRLQSRPQRFIWSGLQSYNDVLQLLAQVDGDLHPLIAPGAVADVLAYSIGCLLGQILVMTDAGGRFADSRLAMFCGGPVFNRVSPVSKFILDSEANVSLYSYLVEHLESHLRTDARLAHYLGGAHPEGVMFRSMMNYRLLREEREGRFRSMAGRMLAVALEQDMVMPPYEVMNALMGSKRDIPARVETLDFPYPYRHEDPFPVMASLEGPVSREFQRVMGIFADFLARPGLDTCAPAPAGV